MQKSEFDSIMEAQNWAGKTNIPFFGGSAMVEINEAGVTFRSQNQSALRTIEKIVGKKFQKINESTIQMRFDEEVKRPGWYLYSLEKGGNVLKLLATPEFVKINQGTKAVKWDDVIDDESGEVYNQIVDLLVRDKSNKAGEKVMNLIKAHLQKGVSLNESLNESNINSIFLMVESLDALDKIIISSIIEVCRKEGIGFKKAEKKGVQNITLETNYGSGGWVIEVSSGDVNFLKKGKSMKKFSFLSSAGAPKITKEINSTFRKLEINTFGDN